MAIVHCCSNHGCYSVTTEIIKGLVPSLPNFESGNMHFIKLHLNQESRVMGVKNICHTENPLAGLSLFSRYIGHESHKMAVANCSAKVSEFPLEKNGGGHSTLPRDHGTWKIINRC